MNIRASLFLLALLPLLCNCASITAGSTQSVAVDTDPAKKASCELKNEKGSWNVKTPGAAVVKKAHGPLTVTCEAKGGYQGSATVESSTAGAAFGNILAGGIIGAAVDMSSGAAYIYPSDIMVRLDK